MNLLATIRAKPQPYWEYRSSHPGTLPWQNITSLSSYIRMQPLNSWSPWNWLVPRYAVWTGCHCPIWPHSKWEFLETCRLLETYFSNYNLWQNLTVSSRWSTTFQNILQYIPWISILSTFSLVLLSTHPKYVMIPLMIWINAVSSG